MTIRGLLDFKPAGDPISIEAGMGFGLTSATDKFAVKLMLNSALPFCTGTSSEAETLCLFAAFG